MSGNGAQGTKFRISVCTEDSLNSNKWNNKKTQQNIHQSIDKYMSIKSNGENRVGKRYAKFNRISSLRNINEKTIQETGRDTILKKQKKRIHLLSQLRYLKLMKSSTGKKSYKHTKMSKLLKLCEVINEADMQEDPCFGIGVNQSNNSIRRNIGRNIILNSLLREKEFESEKQILHNINDKPSKLDGSNKLFNTIKFVY